MHDIKWVRENPEAFDAGLKKRGLSASSGDLMALDEKRRAVIVALEADQARRNSASKEIGQAKASGDEARATALMAEVASLKVRLQTAEEERRTIETALEALLASLPNLPDENAPLGADESDNVEISRTGELPRFDFNPKAHDELGEALGLMDFETAAKLSGARFVVLKGALARLERALAQFMLDTQTTENGYTEISPPILVRSDTMFGTSQLPKFVDDQFKTADDLWLIPTSEVPLTNLVRESIVEDKALPMRVTAHTLCFRREAGSAGRDTRGMIRQHQFSKVEMISITRPEEGEAELARMLGCAEALLTKLGLPFRTVELCTGDMGFSAVKTYDLEVWLPSQNCYREISSCSLCRDFQARRMNARYRDSEGKVRFVNSLNGSGLAVGRTLVAIMENYQQADGSISVPEILLPYMGGLTSLKV